MIEAKEIPSEYVSIRQVWLQNITRCSEAISNRAKPDASEIANWEEVGNRTVVHTINTFYHTLIDYGQAIIRTEVDKYRKEKYNLEVNCIWTLFEEKKLSSPECWNKHVIISEKLFDFIIQTLNKYGMLFQEQPQGYSNVIMEVVE